MSFWKKAVIKPYLCVHDVIKTIDTSGVKIALVVDDEGKLIGTITDGDIRRAILSNISLQSPASGVMNRAPIKIDTSYSRDQIFHMMRERRLNHLPIVDQNGILIGLEVLENCLAPQVRKNPIVLMAGGLSTRLKPLTNHCPKPMLNIGGKPILETIISKFIGYGFQNFYIAVNYQANMIKDYFQNGEMLGVNIQYLQETERRGTAGALSLLPSLTQEPLIVMNGDLLTNVNFEQLLDFHISQEAAATMCIKEYDFQVPFGVVNVNNYCINQIEEKPIQSFFVNAGIYVLDPKAIEYVPSNDLFDMTNLFNRLIEHEHRTVAFPIREYWIDIGRHTDLEKAHKEFEMMLED